MKLTITWQTVEQAKETALSFKKFPPDIHEEKATLAKHYCQQDSASAPSVTSHKPVADKSFQGCCCRISGSKCQCYPRYRCKDSWMLAHFLSTSLRSACGTLTVMCPECVSNSSSTALVCCIPHCPSREQIINTLVNFISTMPRNATRLAFVFIISEDRTVEVESVEMSRLLDNVYPSILTSVVLLFCNKCDDCMVNVSIRNKLQLLLSKLLSDTDKIFNNQVFVLLNT